MKAGMQINAVFICIIRTTLDIILSVTSGPPLSHMLRQLDLNMSKTQVSSAYTPACNSWSCCACVHRSSSLISLSVSRSMLILWWFTQTQLSQDFKANLCIVTVTFLPVYHLACGIYLWHVNACQYVCTSFSFSTVSCFSWNFFISKARVSALRDSSDIFLWSSWTCCFRFKVIWILNLRRMVHL